MSFRLLSELPLKRGAQVMACVLALWSTCQMPAAAAGAEAHHCPVHGCDLLADGDYTGVLIGRLEALLSDKQSRQLLRAVQAQGRWAGLPADSQQFAERIQAVAVRVPIGTGGSLRVIALMSMEESEAMPLKKGDLVRFRPHGGPAGSAMNPAPVDSLALAYWKAVGCVTALCRAGDKDCQATYIQGAWRFTDGRPIEARSAAPLARGQRIDPMTYIPLTSSD
ncbi:hypothetical protein [Ottowia sp. VDI28]|uniref:hypothetical protein n=1 Tax=Ottowia sp. VDI28 TaxID=3133968 RepID=UPI003C2E1110